MIRELKPDVLHGHGAKAGAFMRLQDRTPATGSGSTRRMAARCIIR